jgi:MFS family permease
MQMTGQMWLVYRLTRSPLALGMVGFATQVPMLLLGLFGGAIADLTERRRVLLWTQALSLVQALILAVLTLSGRVQYWQVLALAFFLGAVNAVDMPVRQSFVVGIVAREDLTNAVALNSTLVHAARLVGPALAGLLIPLFGEGICFLINAASFLAILESLRRLRPQVPASSADARGTLETIRQGVAYVAGSPRMCSALAMVAVISLLAMPTPQFLPIFAEEIFHQGPLGLGLMTAAMGAGALIGALALAGRREAQGLFSRISAAAVILGCSMAVFASMRTFSAVLLVLAVCGWSMLQVVVGANTFLQDCTHDAMRGRVMSLFSVTFIGAAPFGSLALGEAARRWGAPHTVMAAGAACVVAGLSQQFMLRRSSAGAG